MCSIMTNATVDETLTELECSDDRRMIEVRLFEFANNANIDNPGGLDTPNHIMRRMPKDLKDIRKLTIGRHRIFFTGHHKKCTYKVFYIKEFKKTGVKEEDDKPFQKILRSALSEPSSRQISKSNKTNEPSNSNSDKRQGGHLWRA